MPKSAAPKLPVREPKPVRKHPITGCRMDTIFGEWLIDKDTLESYRDSGWAILEMGELKNTQARSQDIADAAEEKPFTIQDGMARIAINGPTTKLDTSMSALFGGTSTMRVRKALSQVRQLKTEGKVNSVFLEIDSPGGTVEGTSELAAAIRKTSMVMPVYVHAEDTACSAALWISTQGTRFTCGNTSMVGSLGVRTTLTDASKMGEGSSVKPVVVDTGPYKSIGAPGHPITEQQMAEMRRHVDQLFSVFKGEVQSARRMSADQIKEAATARVFIGQDAVRVGLCDAVCTTDEALTYAKQHANDPQPVPRDPGQGKNNPVAPRSRAMYSETDMASLRKLAGSGMVITAENADQAALQLAVAQNERVTALTEELKTAKAATPAVKTMDPELLRERCGTACERVKLKMDKGLLTGAQAMVVMGAMLSTGTVDTDGNLSADAKPIEALFRKDTGATVYPYEKFLSAFDDAAPTDLNKDVSKHQPAPVAVPGAGVNKKGVDATNTGDKMTLAEANRLRANAGQKPWTKQEYLEQFPEDGE